MPSINDAAVPVGASVRRLCSSPYSAMSAQTAFTTCVLPVPAGPVVGIIWVTRLGRAPRAAPHGLVLMFCARTIGIMYKYWLYFTDTLLVCANPLGSVVVRQTEVLAVLATP